MIPDTIRITLSSPSNSSTKPADNTLPPASWEALEATLGLAITVFDPPQKSAKSKSSTRKPSVVEPVQHFVDASRGIRLYRGDALEMLRQTRDEMFDVVFADPPYFLSNDGMTCQSGKMVSVNKGAWDKAQTFEQIHSFNLAWLRECKRILKPNGTIWVSGTNHNIYSVGFALQTLEFKVLNDIAWFKINPPPNLACRYFTHATETIIWARREPKGKHLFNYAEMKRDNNDKQMQSLWSITPPSQREKKWGKHPTQKPEALLDRIVRASSNAGDLVLDPFCGSGTTGVVCARLGRRFVGFDISEEYLNLAQKRIGNEIAARQNQPHLNFSIDVINNGGGGLMADLSFYQAQFGLTTPEAVFEKFVGTLQNYYDAGYYVDWSKVRQKVAPFRRELALLSTLCDEDDRECAARNLLRDYPQVLPVLPILIGCRGEVQMVENAGEARVTQYPFVSASQCLSEKEVEHYTQFLLSSGVLQLLRQISSVGDYVTGVEVGMDTNARKNRGGDCGVKAIEPFIAQAQQQLPAMCSAPERTYEHLKSLGCTLPSCFAGIKWDRAFWTKEANEKRRFVVAEINHYGSSGSKPPAIAREYAEREQKLKNAGVGFIWVTDGLGWRDMKNPLREAFVSIDFMVNIKLASDGLLEHALKQLLRL